MATNIRLQQIAANMPDFDECRNLFFEHYFGFQKLGIANYAALLHATGWTSPTNEIVAFFLAGMAFGQVSGMVELDTIPIDITDIHELWKLVEEELDVLLPAQQKEGD